MSVNVSYLPDNVCQSGKHDEVLDPVSPPHVERVELGLNWPKLIVMQVLQHKVFS